MNERINRSINSFVRSTDPSVVYYDEWKEMYKDASVSIDNRDELLAACAEEIEDDLEFR